MAQDISALVFDAYGTIFDVHSVTRLAETLFPGRGAALSAAWRSKQLEYTWLRSIMGRYEDFSRVTQSSLEWSLESLGLEPDEAARRSLIDEYRRLGTFPEVPAALEALAAA
ncbi:MAG: HAD-IA family hydrolase, partial [Usitatibacter sp.]